MRRPGAGIRTARAVSPMQEVMTHANVGSGNRHILMPLQRRSRTLGIKFNDPNSWPTQKMAMESAQITTPEPCPGPATAPTALSGAYWVHPPRVGPSPTKNDKSMTQNATNVVQNDIMLKCGKGMSSAPGCMGKQ